MSSPDTQLFRALFEAAPNGLMVIDDAGMIIQANTLCEKMFGYSRHELDGRSVEVLVPKRLRTLHLCEREQFNRAPQIRAMGAGRDLVGVKKNGVEFPVEIGLNLLETETGRVFVAAVVDITSRKHAAEEQRILDNCRERIDLCQHLGISAVVIDSDGRVLCSNALLRQSQSQVSVQDEQIHFAHPAAARGYKQVLADFARGETKRAVRSLPVPAHGGYGPGVCHLVPVKGVSGRALGILVIRFATEARPPPPDLLRGLFGLTPAEGRTAVLIGTGLSPRKAADQLGVSEGSLRTTLKHVFNKVGVSRQAELAVLLTLLLG